MERFKKRDLPALVMIEIGLLSAFMKYVLPHMGYGVQL